MERLWVRRSENRRRQGASIVLTTESSGTGFERQPTLIHTASGMDGSGAIAADKAVNVYVFWHAPLPAGKNARDRRVWLAQSTDDGETLGPERVAFDQPPGYAVATG